MADQYLCTAINDNLGNTTAAADISEGTEHMREQLNNVSSVSTSFGQFDSNHQVTEPTEGDEIQYVKDCLQELYEAGQTIDGDAWIIADGADFDLWGYGRAIGRYVTDDGQQELWGARVIHTPSQLAVPDPIDTFYNLTIHELSHLFTVDHIDGSYSRKDNLARLASPMATAYTYDNDDEPDSCYEGSATPPDNFNCGPENRIQENWCDAGCADACRHQVGMTDCTLDIIDNNAPL